MVFSSIPIHTLHCSIGIWEAVFGATMRVLRWTETIFNYPWLALNRPTAELEIHYIDYPVGLILDVFTLPPVGEETGCRRTGSVLQCLTCPAGRRAARGSSVSPNPSRGPTRGPRRSPAPGPSRPDSSGGSPPSPGGRAERTAFRKLTWGLLDRVF